MTEERLQALYGVDLKWLQFEHKGMRQETFVPVYRAGFPTAGAGPESWEGRAVHGHQILEQG